MSENLSAITLNEELANAQLSDIISFRLSVKSSGSIVLSDMQFLNKDSVDLYVIYGVICAMKKKLENEVDVLEFNDKIS